MRVDSLTSTGSHLILRKQAEVARGSQNEGPVQKTLGETPPIKLSLGEIGALASLFAPSGLVGRIKKRLNYLKKKKCKVVPAKGTTACIDNDDIVYLGVEFLEAYQDDPETLAGVMAHEWGHACAVKPEQEHLNEMNWNEIFDLRRAHETLADEISGRLLCLMGYSPEGLIKFLKKGKDTHNLKYHHADLRAKVVRYGFEAEKRKKSLARDLFPGNGYKNDYDTILLDIS